jgi:hypothetical protein
MYMGNDNILTSKDDYQKIQNEVQSQGEKNKTRTEWTYALGNDICECWKASERKILRICGVIYSKGNWIIRYNYELQSLYEYVGIVTLIIVRRLNWIGHINRTDDTTKN